MDLTPVAGAMMFGCVFGLAFGFLGARFSEKSKAQKTIKAYEKLVDELHEAIRDGVVTDHEKLVIRDAVVDAEEAADK